MSLKENKLFEILSFIFTLFFRVIPINSSSGVIKIGNPTSKSPVVLTSNYSLTVRKVRKALKHLDCYLLIIPTNGINVWCSSVGKIFSTEKLLISLRAFGIESLVNHRNLIVPQLAASGINKWTVLNQGGWNIVWGPTDITKIEEYLSGNELSKVTEVDRRVSFTRMDSFEMTCAITGSFFLRFSLIVLILFGLKYFVIFPIITWISVYPIYFFYAVNKKISWYLKPFVTTAFVTIIFCLFTNFHIEFILLGIGIIFLLEWSLYSYLPYIPCKYSSKFFGMIESDLDIDASKCSMCLECLSVCPVGALSIYEMKIDVCNSACVNCGACSNQCENEAIVNIKAPKGFGVFSH